MKKLFTLFLATMANLVMLNASDTEVNGIWYDFSSSDKTATVTYRGAYYSAYANEYEGDVVIPDTVTYEGQDYAVVAIGQTAFYRCKTLKSVTIPSTINTFGQSAFSSCDSLNAVYISDLKVWCSAYFENQAANPISCSKKLYLNGKLLTDLVIPDGITKISSYAFYYCSPLTSVTIPASVTSVGSSAFSLCNELKSVHISDMNAWLAIDFKDSNPLYNAKVLYLNGTLVTDVVIPEGLTEIKKYTFYGCESLTSVSLPNSIKTIGDYAFSGCTGLTSLTIPASVTNIGQMAFGNCSGLKSLTLSEGLEAIKSYAFQACPGLTSLTLPASLTEIGNGAFTSCFGLSSVTIPDNITNIGSSAFFKIPNVIYSGTSTNAPFGALSMNGFVEGDLVYSDETKTSLLACFPTATGHIIIPNSVTSIGNSAFYHCEKLTSVFIPGSVATIGNYAFGYCSSLTAATIADGVKTIGEFAFDDCKALSSIEIPSSVKKMEMYVFSGCSGMNSVLWNAKNCGTLTSKGTFPQTLKALTIGLGTDTLPAYLCWGAAMELTSVTSMSVTPPVVGKAGSTNAFKGVDFDKTVLYVPEKAIEAYHTAEGWSAFTKIHPITIQAETADVPEAQAQPTDTSVVVEWPFVENAVNYTIEIKKEGELICSLSFDADGQLHNVRYAMTARNKNNKGKCAEATAAGWKYTVAGLETDVIYEFTVVARGSANETLYNKTVAFKTANSATDITNVQNCRIQATKVLMDGVLYIIRDGKMFDVRGQKTK